MLCTFCPYKPVTPRFPLPEEEKELPNAAVRGIMVGRWEDRPEGAGFRGRRLRKNWGDGMVIVIDIGNTTVAVSGILGEQVVFTGQTPTNPQWDTGQYIAALRPMLAGVSCRGAILSSVVPTVTEAVAGAAAALLGKAPMPVTEDMESGLRPGVPEWSRVGKDRIADAAWAAAHFPLPAVTADLGTATTLNLILPGGIFAGGIICPGLQTGLSALSRRTAQLPELTVERPRELIGKSTRQCMLSGAVRGTAAMVDGLVSEIEEELGTPVTLLLTGGGGKYVTEFLRHRHTFDPHMTRKGLALLYALNAPGEHP